MARECNRKWSEDIVNIVYSSILQYQSAIKLRSQWEYVSPHGGVTTLL